MRERGEERESRVGKDLYRVRRSGFERRDKWRKERGREREGTRHIESEREGGRERGG